MWWRSIFWSGLIYGSLMALLPHLAWLVSWCVGRFTHSRIPYAPFGWTALGLVLVVWGVLAYGHFWGMWKVEVTAQTYVSREVPAAFDGYRIVHISDLHVDTYNDKPEALRRIVDRVNGLQPDLILFTGDMVTGQMESVLLHEQTLRRLHARDGVMSVLGNHDFFIYDKQYQSLRERLAAADSLTRFEQQRLGWQVLRNEHRMLRLGADSICIAGVDNINGRQGFSTIQMGDLRKALDGVDSTFTILMTHDPSHWRAEVLPQSRVQITLSGHTHASQVRIFGWSLAHFAFHECDGRYDDHGRMLYVNAGIGSTIPMRFGCPSEITVLTLKRKE